MKGLVVKKSLIGKQDLLLGRQSETQQRGKHFVNIDPLEFIAPVRSLEDLKQLNPKQFETAFIFGENTIDVIDPAFGGIDEHLNELFYFDFNSQEDENIPFVVKSNITKLGRWKLSRLGEKRLYRIALPIISEVVEDKTNEIAKGLDEKIEPAVEKGLKHLEEATTKQGLYFDKRFVYKPGDLARCFINTDQGIKTKLFMVKRNLVDGTSEEPLIGDIEDVGNMRVFSDTATLSDKWEPLNLKPKTKEKVTIDNGEFLELYEGQQNPIGTLKVTLYDNINSVAGRFFIEFSGTGIQDFRIYNVLYSRTIQNKGLAKKVGQMRDSDLLIYLPSFAIGCSENSFGLHIPSTEFIKYVELNWSQCNQAPTMQLSFNVPDKRYAVREGGGSYIANLGEMTYFNLNAQASQEVKYFKQFMMGKIEWKSGMVLNADTYHQYNDPLLFLNTTNLDVSDIYLRNLGNKAGSTSGVVQQPQLPNITGGYGSDGSTGAPSGYGGNWAAYGANPVKAVGAITSRSNTNVGTPSTYTSAAGVYFNFDASKSSSVYSDAGDTRPKSLVSILMLQVF